MVVVVVMHARADTRCVFNSASNDAATAQQRNSVAGRLSGWPLGDRASVAQWLNAKHCDSSKR